MRIATRTGSALICKSDTRAFHCLSNCGVPGVPKERLLGGPAIRGTPVQGVVQTDHHRAVFLATVKRRYRSSRSPVSVCLAISPRCHAACFFWPVETMYAVICGCGSSWTTTTEPPDELFTVVLKLSPKSLKRYAVSNSELCSHTCHLRRFLQLLDDSTSGKSIQMSI
ncbi:hypothetical protein TNCV_3906601 [Trichonephila clavipes]|nr:hypothetical protein TNCV_3906601 [Trichonephila clavipes]